jgi:uncharacterized delta-60 repeat protein
MRENVCWTRWPFWLSLAALAVAVPALAEGILDVSFSGDGKRTLEWDSGYAVARVALAQPDGRLLVGGSVGTAPNIADFGVARFQPDGELDTGFGDSGGTVVPIDALVSGQDDLEALEIDALGRINLLGVASATASARIPALARLSSAGDLDLTFGDQGIVKIETWAWTGQIGTTAVIGHQGGFVFAGSAFPSGPTAARGLFLLRLNGSGAVDTDFGALGWRRVELGSGRSVGALAVDALGRIYAATSDSNGTPFVEIFRFTAGGTLDLSYGGGDGVATAAPGQNLTPRDLAFDPKDGSLVVGLSNGSEQSTPTRGSICRFTPAGVFDSAFDWVETAYDEGSTIEEIAIQGDRKIVGVGRINGPGAQTGGLLFVRLLPDGTFDDTFDGNGRIRVEIDLDPNERDGGLGLTLHGGRALGVGFATEADLDQQFALARLTTALIFGDGFDSGGTSFWSLAVP